ncbi:MAG: adenylate kinase [Acuticoccus sp.]
MNASAPLRRIHLTGASGAGVTTLGRAVAQELGLPHHDTDDYYWMPTDPPFQVVRPAADRTRLMHEMFVPRSGWVLSGSVGEWAREVEPYVELVVFVRTEDAERSRRLVAREVRRRSRPAAEIAVDPDFLAFHDWAMRYEAETPPPSRSLVRHERWLAAQSVPVVRVDGAAPLAKLTEIVLHAIAAAGLRD